MVFVPAGETAQNATSNRSAIIDQRIAPVTMANEQLLSVPEALLPLFPAGGLQQGWSLGFAGPGGWSLAMALLGSALGSDGWSACVGLEDFGLVAADEYGLCLDRVLMVETPPPKQLATVAAALIEVVDVVCLGRTAPIGIRDARRLMARAREQQAVLFHLDGGRSWPQPLDVNLTVETRSWSGIGIGHGRLGSRSASVTAVGRRSMAKPRRVDVLLPGPDGGVEPDVAGEGRSGSVIESVSAEAISPVGAGKGKVGEWPAFA